MYKNILFDLDGTLLDTTIGVIEAVKITINELGLPSLKPEVLATFVGPPMQSSLMKHFGMEPERALECANMFRANYKKYSLFSAEPYPGALELLKSLKETGHKVAVATYKSHENAMGILEKFGILKYCDFAMGSDLDGRLTKTDIVNECIKQLDADRTSTVLIGDSSADARGAYEADIDFIALTYGFGFKSAADLKNIPHVAVCSNIDELASYLSVKPEKVC